MLNKNKSRFFLKNLKSVQYGTKCMLVLVLLFFFLMGCVQPEINDPSGGGGTDQLTSVSSSWDGDYKTKGGLNVGYVYT